MKTRYVDYRNYLINSGNKTIVDCFELSLEGDTNEELVDWLWSRLETNIALLPYELAYPYLKSYNDENWSDSYHHDFQYEIEKMAGYWPSLKDNLTPWIETIKYTKADEKLKKIINSTANYISFNYTNTMENLYHIDKNDICYIHGDASKEKELILGHRNDSYYPEWDDSNTDEDVRLLNAGVFMEGFREETYKPIEHICATNEKYNRFISDYRYLNIYMMGLSYNDIDKAYIERVCKKQKSKWYFVCYSDDDYSCVREYAKDIGASDYCVMGYEDI